MKLRTDSIARIFVTLLLAICSIQGHGQGTTSSNPLEYAAIGEGEGLIGEHVKKQTKILDTCAVLHGGMVVSERKMRKWQEKYNSYLKTAQGYASAIQAGTTLYMEGIQTLSALWEIKTACRINPQGIAASLSMNNLYAETATELVKTYKILKQVVAMGGKGNMLNGAECIRLLWQLSSEIEQLNKKFRALALSIGIFSFEDVWNRAITGKIEKTNGMLAAEAHKRMSRAMKQVALFYKARQEK